MKLLLPHLILFSISLFNGCSNTENFMTINELESLINSHLSPGDSHEKIEKFLREQGFPFGYDRFRKRYYSEYPPARKKYKSGMEETVAVDIYVDDDKTFKDAVVRKLYTYF